MVFLAGKMTVAEKHKHQHHKTDEGEEPAVKNRSTNKNNNMPSTILPRVQNYIPCTSFFNKGQQFAHCTECKSDLWIANGGKNNFKKTLWGAVSQISDKGCWKQHHHAFKMLPQRDLPVVVQTSDLIWDIHVLFCFENFLMSSWLKNFFLGINVMHVFIYCEYKCIFNYSFLADFTILVSLLFAIFMGKQVWRMQN